MSDILKRKYFIGQSEGFPEVADGQVLYDSEGNKLYIDIDNQRKLVNEKPEINTTALDDSSALPTSGVVKNALDSALNSAEQWKSGGNDEDVLSKDGEGNLNWMDIHNALYWVKLRPGPWEEIIENQNYATDYEIGKTVDLDFGEYGVHPMELVAIDTDIRSDGDITKNNGKARMTWICKDILVLHEMNESNTNDISWPDTALRSWLRGTILPLFPEILKDNIVEVTKTYYQDIIGENGTFSVSDTIWIPSMREIFGTTNYEDSGVDYKDKFNSASKRTKYLDGTAIIWWTRSAQSESSSNFRVVDGYGNAGWVSAINLTGVVPGFCL